MAKSDGETMLHPACNGEALRIATDRLDQRNVYAINPAFDR